MELQTAYQQFIKTFGNKVKINESLARYTTFKIGGPADLFINASSHEELVEIVTKARELSIPLFILGGGTNILVTDSGFCGLVVKNSSSSVAIVGMKGTVTKGKSTKQVFVQSDAGTFLNKLVRFTLDEGLSGLEMHLGLPGTVGGAVVNNSKWTRPNGFVGDVVSQALILTTACQVKLVPKSYFQFSYGKSSMQKNGDILLSVVFTLIKKDTETVWNIANESIAYRRETQPQGVATAGCVFKNISDSEALKFGTPDHTTSVGKLLDLTGMKGFSIGGAVVSKKHANFIENQGKATASDVLQLIRIEKERVKKKFGVTLREEIQIVGEI